MGDASIGDGPLNVIVARLPSISIDAPCRIDITTAVMWRVSLFLEAAGEREGLLESAISAAPPESFIHAMAVREPASPMHRRAGTGIAALRRGDFDEAVGILAGLGHGLTPSGDDVLAGALLMLHALGRTQRAAALADAVRRIAPARTSPLSYALLEPACDGEPNAAVAQAISAVLTGAPAEAVIAPLRNLGATSGFDILAGMLVAASL